MAFLAILTILLRTMATIPMAESKRSKEGEDWESDRKTAKNEAEARVRKLSRPSVTAAGERNSHTHTPSPPSHLIKTAPVLFPAANSVEKPAGLTSTHVPQVAPPSIEGYDSPRIRVFPQLVKITNDVHGQVMSLRD